MANTQKTYTISFHCKPIKKLETVDAFKEKVATLGDSFFLSFTDKTPVITTSVNGVHEVHGVLTTIESVCSTTVEFIGTAPGLL